MTVGKDLGSFWEELRHIINNERVTLKSRPLTKGVVAGRVQTTVKFPQIRKRHSPYQFLGYLSIQVRSRRKEFMGGHPQQREEIVSLIGLHHMQYESTPHWDSQAKYWDTVYVSFLFLFLFADSIREKITRWGTGSWSIAPLSRGSWIPIINSQVPSHSRLGRTHQFRIPVSMLNDDEILLTPTVVHGFSFTDKAWCKQPHRATRFYRGTTVHAVRTVLTVQSRAMHVSGFITCQSYAHK